MSTKPTRLQDRGCDKLAEALLLIAEAARLDGHNPIDGVGLAEIAGRIARVSPSLGLDVILARALESRGQGLGLRAGTAELLTLIEGEVEPIASLLLDDQAFKELVRRAEADLGEV